MWPGAFGGASLQRLRHLRRASGINQPVEQMCQAADGRCFGGAVFPLLELDIGFGVKCAGERLLKLRTLKRTVPCTKKKSHVYSYKNDPFISCWITPKKMRLL